MARIICDTYIKSNKKIWGDDIHDEFNQRILAVNNMYGWLYEKGILEKVSLQFKDYKEATYFALDAKDLLPYRQDMENSGITGATLSARHIFDESYTPCTYSGAITLGWTMSGYRSVDGCVGRSWECGLVQNLDVKGIYEVSDVRDSEGVRAAVKALFAQFDWKPTLSEQKFLDLPDLSLAARLVSFYKDFDFYDFMDNMELSQTEEDLIADLEKQLNDPKSAASILESVKQIFHEECLTPEQAAETGRLIHDIGILHTKTPSKASLKDQIASADSRKADSLAAASAKGKDVEPEI